jgi:hypothetical protein
MDEPNLMRQMSTDTTSCYWCGAAAIGTARDEHGDIFYTCGQKGHGKP